MQTHYLADRREANLVTEGLLAEYRSVMLSWWCGLDDLTSLNFAEYLRCVFTEQSVMSPGGRGTPAAGYAEDSGGPGGAA